MIYKMDLKDSSDTMTFNLLETPIVDKDIEGAVDNVTLDGNQYTDYLYLKKQYIQKWAIMCPDEYDELRGFYTRQFEEGEVPSYRVYYGANVTRDYTLNGDYFQFNAEGIETGMTLSQLTGNAEQTTYSGKNKLNYLDAVPATNQTTTAFIDNGFRSVTTSTGYATKITLSVKPSTTYTLSWTVKKVSGTMSPFVRVYEGTGTSTQIMYVSSANDGSYHGSFTTASGVTQVNIWFYNGTPMQGTTDWTFIQLEESATKTDYELYVGGTASPNPDYPQPISTVTGAQTVVVTGKNLVEESIEANIDSSGKMIADNRFCMNIAQVVQGMTYTATEGEHFVAGFFTSKPSINSTSYDGQRIVVLNERTHTFEAPITGYVAFRSSDGYTTAQLELGSTATAYEPYQGQEYEVNLGKNLFSISQDTIISNAYLNNNATLTFADLNSVSITATGTQGAQYLYRIISGLDSTKSYTFSFKAIKNVKGSTGLPYIRITTSGSNDGSTWTNLGFSGNTNPTEGETYSFAKTLTGYSQYRFMIFNNVDTPVQIGETTTFFDMQLEEGAQTSFAPYFTPIELAKIGNYQDRIYKDDGKWYIEKQIGKVVLNGSENWSLYPNKTHTFRVGAPHTITNAICDHFVSILASKFDIAAGTYTANTGFFIISYPDMADVASLKTWLASNPTTFYCAGAQWVTTTEITDETLLSQLNFLASLYGGVNNISLVGTGAQGEMEVFIRDVMSVETDVVPEVPVRLTLTDDGVINACGCRRNVQLTMRETTE